MVYIGKCDAQVVDARKVFGDILNWSGRLTKVWFTTSQDRE